jgi:hypothetical protein
MKTNAVPYETKGPKIDYERKTRIQRVRIGKRTRKLGIETCLSVEKRENKTKERPN